MIKIQIDNRENFKIENATYSNLDIGDVIISYNNKIVYLIERKTWCDLASSIKDGRYKSQKMRLIKYALENDLNRSAIIYLLEGKIPTNAINGISLSALQSACVNMQVRDGFRIYHTLDPVTFINKISNCLTKYGCYQDRVAYNVEDNIIKSKVAVKKKKNMTPDNVYINQLMIIPGVSLMKAKAIKENYNSLPKLIEEVKDEDSLKEIKLSNGRKLGPVLSKRIYEFLHYNKEK